MNSTHEQDVVNAKSSIQDLKDDYMASLNKLVTENKANPTDSENNFLEVQQKANTYFNYIENFVGDSNLLGAHNNGHWVIGFAEDCLATLESLIIHFQLIRKHCANSNPNLLSQIEPSPTAYANMQRMIHKYLTKKITSEIKLKLESENLPVYGFNNNKVPIMSKTLQTILSFSFGVIFVIALLVIAFIIPTPTDFQYTVFRIVLSLAAGGVVATFPGFIEVTLGKWLRSGGALAVFVLVYFYSPAPLEVQKSSELTSTVELSTPEGKK